MADIKHKFDASLVRHATIHVIIEPTARYKFRLRVAIILLRIAAAIAGYKGVTIKDG